MTNLDAKRHHGDSLLREGMVALDVLGGSVLALVAGWAWLVCDVSGGGACGCTMWLLPAGALLAASGALLTDGSTAAYRAAIGFQFAAALLLSVAAAAQLMETGWPGWPGLGVALVLAEAVALTRES